MNPNTLQIKICESAKEAPNWVEDYPDTVPLDLTKAIIVRKGMESGNDTVDLVLTDSEGKQYVTMITARLLKTVTDMTVIVN